MGALPVVILAAGRGRRLAPLTDELPKCLLPLGATSPLALLVEAVGAIDAARDLVVVTGHAWKRIEWFFERFATTVPSRQVECIFNPDYDRANNIVSVWIARERCEDGFLLVNSDVVCHPRILADALSAEETFLVVDPTLPPRGEAMKVRYTGERLTEIGKELEPDRADGEYIGIARFDRDGATTLYREIQALLERGGQDQWYEAAIGLAARSTAIGRRTTAGLPWIEIDDPDDLRRAGDEILPALGPATFGDKNTDD